MEIGRHTQEEELALDRGGDARVGHIISYKGLTINCTNEFVQSHFSDGVLILRYINKMGTNGGAGVVIDSIYGPVFRPHAHRPHAFLDGICEV